MSQTKVQLIAPIGVVTASTLETTGVLTATTFVGDIAGTVTGITSTTDNLNLGIITATSFAGDFTGIGSGLTGTPNVVAGIVTATKFIGNTPGTVSGLADGTNINAGIITATSFVGNLTGNAAGLSTTTAQLTLGIVTATSYSGSGANLDGVSSGPVAQQAVTADGATTTIDLSSGNLIYMTQSADTTVSFANTEGNTDVVYLIRTKDDNTTARTITWPSGLAWNGGTEPTLLTNAGGVEEEAQVFKLTTRDNGATWYGVEVVNLDNLVGYGRWNIGGIGGYGGAGTNVTATYYTSPVQTAGTWSALSVGNIQTQFAVRSNKTLWASGRNSTGEMGVNNTTAYSSPVQIPGTNWGNMMTGSNNASTLLTKTDGTLWGMGLNFYGGLGQNNRTYYSSPVQIPGTTWRSSFWSIVQGSNQWSCAIKTDGTLWSWGYGHFGQLGLNQSFGSGPTPMLSSPTQIPGTTWSKIGGDGNGPFGIKTDGTLWSWGYNGRGQLGQNSTVHRSSPTQIPGTTWKEAVGNGQSSGAIKTDGTLWVWGDDQYGQLAQNQTATQRWSSPVQVPGTTWNAVRIGGSSTFYANKTDGTLWSWGANHNGEMGAGSAGTLYSSPVQIPGTNWKSVQEYGFGTNKNGAAILRSS